MTSFSVAGRAFIDGESMELYHKHEVAKTVTPDGAITISPGILGFLDGTYASAHGPAQVKKGIIARVELLDTLTWWENETPKQVIYSEPYYRYRNPVGGFISLARKSVRMNYNANGEMKECVPNEHRTYTLQMTKPTRSLTEGGIYPNRESQYEKAEWRVKWKQEALNGWITGGNASTSFNTLPRIVHDTDTGVIRADTRLWLTIADAPQSIAQEASRAAHKVVNSICKKDIKRRIPLLMRSNGSSWWKTKEDVFREVLPSEYKEPVSGRGT